MCGIYCIYLFIFISSLFSIVIIFSIGFVFSVLDICFGSPFGWIVDMGLGNDLDVTFIEVILDS